MIRIAVVDDEPITRMDICGMLQDLGYEVAGEAGDGFDAVALCRQTHPDAVLMDVKMPVFDGLSAAQTILEEDLAGCVVLLTAFSDEEIVEKAGRIGVTGYLMKPVEQGRVRPVIELAIAQSRRLQESRRETKEAQKKLDDSRVISRAVGLYAKKQGITEADAYTVLRSTAMDKRLPMAVIAQAFLDQEAQG